MAVHTGSPDMTEDRILVTPGALRDSVTAHQMITGLVMLKVHCLIQCRPGLRCVAILAIPFEFSMRIAAACLAQDNSACK